MAYNEFGDGSKHTLSAVNMMLNTIGEASIDDEKDMDSILEAKLAREDLMEVKREVLSSGWDANEDVGYELAVDTQGYISVPANVLHLNSTDGDLSRRDGRLYSKSSQSSRFEDAQTVNILWDLTFNSIPQSLRNYITLKACKRFRDRTVGSDSVAHGYTQEDERDAYMEARRNELSSTNASMLSNMNVNGLL